MATNLLRLSVLHFLQDLLCLRPKSFSKPPSRFAVDFWDESFFEKKLVILKNFSADHYFSILQVHSLRALSPISKEKEFQKLLEKFFEFLRKLSFTIFKSFFQFFFSTRISSTSNLQMKKEKIPISWIFLQTSLKNRLKCKEIGTFLQIFSSLFNSAQISQLFCNFLGNFL